MTEIGATQTTPGIGNCDCPATCGGNARGNQCKFPFKYNGKTYTACTSEGHDRTWCYTDDDGTWGNCDCPSTCEGDARGNPCKFPFKYNGKTYTACTSEGHHKDWCYTDDDGHWGHCDCR